MLKRLTAILCIAALCAVAFGCAAPGQGGDAAGKPVLKIGYDNYEPYSYYDENGQLTGIDYELAVEACERLGYTPQFTEIAWEQKNDLLASGQIDCIWSCYSMTGREDDYQWAGPYMNSYQAAVVRSDSGIEHLSELKGKRVAVEATTKSEEAWVEHAGQDVPKAASILTYSSMAETIAAVRMGYADALSGHVGPMSALVASSDGTLTLLPDAFYSTQVGVAFDKDFADQELVQRLDEVLEEMHDDGTIARVVKAYGMDPEQVAEVRDDH